MPGKYEKVYEYKKGNSETKTSGEFCHCMAKIERKTINIFFLL